MTRRDDMTTVLSHLMPLFALARKGVAEVVVSGVSYFKREGQLAQGGDTNVMIVARSLLKPWQFLAADIADSGVALEPFWALGLASHSGQAPHMAALQKLAEAAQASEEDLFCPRGYPLDSAEAWLMQSAHLKPSRWHHPCAGKHLLAIAACRRHGFPIEKYWDVDHPLQKRLAFLIGQQLGERPLWMTDSCGMPTLAATARAQIQMWERLSQSTDEKVAVLRNLWMSQGRLIGGAGRLDSDLMEVSPGQILAKEGADGLLAMVALPEKGQPGATVFIKLGSGYNATHLALALWALLSKVSDLPAAFLPVVDYLKARLEKWVPADQELVLPTQLAP
jgi:L-asparaginase II